MASNPRPYTSKGGSGKLLPDRAPLLPVTISRGSTKLSISALVDSGSDISVLPHSIGLKLGVDWNSLTMSATVGGAVQGIAGKLLSLDVAVDSFTPVQILFIWLERDGPPPILGQFNFFQEFDVCFFGSKQEFQVQPRTP